MIKIIIGSVIAVVVIGIILFIVLGKRKKNIKFDFEKFIELLGGKSNIEDASFNNSRLSVMFKDKTLIKKEELQEMGASGIIINSKKITLVMGVLSESICSYILKNKEWL